MNISTKPKMHPPGTKGSGVLVLKGKPRSECDHPPRAIWRVVDGDWKLVSLVRPDGTLEPLPGYQGAPAAKKS